MAGGRRPSKRSRLISHLGKKPPDGILFRGLIGLNIAERRSWALDCSTRQALHWAVARIIPHTSPTEVLLTWYINWFDRFIHLRPCNHSFIPVSSLCADQKLIRLKEESFCELHIDSMCRKALCVSEDAHDIFSISFPALFRSLWPSLWLGPPPLLLFSLQLYFMHYLISFKQLGQKFFGRSWTFF